MKTSPFILREVLGEDCRLALTGAEQRDLHACAVRLASLGADLLAPLPGRGTRRGDGGAAGFGHRPGPGRRHCRTDRNPRRWRRVVRRPVR